MRRRDAGRFTAYIGVDYSGAKTPTTSLKGLRVCEAELGTQPREVLPPKGPRKYWTRRGVAELLVELLRSDRRLLVGIDHGFSFPRAYFERHRLRKSWAAFLEDFAHHWPTDEDHTYVDFVRDGDKGRGAARSGDSSWRRITEVRAGSAKSVFHFDVPGSVAKSTHAGLPWLRYLRRGLGSWVHCWPFDGWEVPEGRSVLAEVYPSLWRHAYPRGERDGDQHDAYSIVAFSASLTLSCRSRRETRQRSRGGSWELGSRADCAVCADCRGEAGAFPSARHISLGRASARCVDASDARRRPMHFRYRRFSSPV